MAAVAIGDDPVFDPISRFDNADLDQPAVEISLARKRAAADGRLGSPVARPVQRDCLGGMAGPGQKADAHHVAPHRVAWHAFVHIKEIR